MEIRINGEVSGLSAQGGLRLGDLIELIKSQIDPEHMITGILLNGSEIEDELWTSSTTSLETSILEVETGTPDSFVDVRLSRASEIVRSCYLEFREARKCFQAGQMTEGNQSLIAAVNTTRSFFQWYSTLLELVDEKKRADLDISGHVHEITEICKRICQQQLYQSWWALGETIGRELEPKLDGLEDFFRKYK